MRSMAKTIDRDYKTPVWWLYNWINSLNKNPTVQTSWNNGILDLLYISKSML